MARMITNAARKLVEFGFLNVQAEGTFHVRICWTASRWWAANGGEAGKSSQRPQRTCMERNVGPNGRLTGENAFSVFVLAYPIAWTASSGVGPEMR